MYQPFRAVVLILLLISLVARAATEQEAHEWYRSLDLLPATKSFLTKEERQQLFRLARHHKVAALEMVAHYDPSGEIGFCFGRAMAVHLIARGMGLQSQSLRKLFVIGDLRSGSDPEWRFHVTTVVKGEDGLWYSVDPIMEPPLASGVPLKMERWIQIVQRTWDKPKKANFYFVENSTIIPDLRNVPEADKETGENVIEVSFNPNAHSEFVSGSVAGFPYFEVSSPGQERFFTTVYEREELNRFSFLGIRINGHAYDYRNYFVDLLFDLKGNE